MPDLHRVAGQGFPDFSPCQAWLEKIAGCGMSFREHLKYRLKQVRMPFITPEPSPHSDDGQAPAMEPDDMNSIAHPYKRLLPPELVISMALQFLPTDGTDWRPRLKAAHKELAASWLIGDAADLPAKVALYAFESMGHQYMEVKNGDWRLCLSSIAHEHHRLLRGEPSGDRHGG
jgi:hypothetical protein